MPTTTTVDTTLSVNAVGNRTDFAGSAVDDISAEEFRFNGELITEGILKPADAFEVVEGGGATMDVVVGSGTAKQDYAYVDGQVSGQGGYLVRLDETSKTISLSASDASDRTDEIYLVILDDAYDSSTFGLPVLAVREGDAGSGAPGPDSSWDAYLLLASVLVPSGAADITECTITDERVDAGLIDRLLATTVGSFIEIGYEFGGSFTIGDNSETTAVSTTFTPPSDWNEYEILVKGSWSGEHFTGGEAVNFQVGARVVIDGDNGDRIIQSGSTSGELSSTGTPLQVSAAHHVSGLSGNITIALNSVIFGEDAHIAEWYTFIEWTAKRTS